MRLTTDAIDENGYFDSRYTCDFDNSSPELRWTDVPEGTRCFAVIAEDTDMGFSHWVVYQIPPELRHLPAGIPPQDSLPNGIRQGVNGFSKLGYAGPCPPSQHHAHHYVFRIYALRSTPEVPHRANREELLAAIRSEIIAQTEISGSYRRLVQKAG